MTARQRARRALEVFGLAPRAVSVERHTPDLVHGEPDGRGPVQQWAEHRSDVEGEAELSWQGPEWAFGLAVDWTQIGVGVTTQREFGAPGNPDHWHDHLWLTLHVGPWQLYAFREWTAPGRVEAWARWAGWQDTAAWPAEQSERTS